MKQYDVAVIGGGITGSAVAWQLGHYALRTVLLEKECDTGFGVSKANSGIIHGGFHYSARDTLKGKLELRGNQLYDAWQKELGFPLVRCGILVVAFTPEERPAAERLYRCGVENQVPGIEFCERARLRELEEKLSPAALCGVYAPQGGVVEPYRVVFALTESARSNGVELCTEFRVSRAERAGGVWRIFSQNGEAVEAKYAVNAAGLYADEVSALFGGEKFRILPRKGEEYLLDRLSAARPRHVIFPVPAAHTKGVLVIPTAGGTTMIGPTAELTEDKTDTATTEANKTAIFAQAGKMVSGISSRDLITSFSGSRPVMEGREDFFIERSRTAENLIQAAGILSPGLTSAPAIAERIVSLLHEAGLELPPRRGYSIPAPVPALRDLTPEQADALHEKDPAWTQIVCRCEKVSEAEIRAAVRQGHTTLDGVKLATRAGMGRCQGGFCTRKILHIISEETGIPLEEIVKRETGGTILSGVLGVSGEETLK